MNIRWLGQAAFQFTYGDIKVLIDPWIKANPVCPVELEEVLDADVILITHGHFDHFGDAMEIMERSQAAIVCDPEISWYMHKRGYVRNQRLFPIAQGGAVKIKGLTITAVPAIHPSSIYGEEWHTEKKWFPNASAFGYVIQAEGEPTIYHSGDTALFSDMSLISKRYKPDISILPIGGRFTMDVVDAEEAVGFLKSATIIPMHYNTNPELIADEHEFKRAVEANYPGTEVIIMAPGEFATGLN